jgi:hypothetical protein
MDTIQRWNRDKSAGDQNCPARVFPFVSQELSDYDIYPMDYVLSKPSGQLVEEREKNNLSKTQHNSTVNSRDMTTEALLAPPNSALLSRRIFSTVSPLFFWIGGLFVVLKANFPLITILSFIYAFMYLFYFSRNLSSLFLLKSLFFIEL